MAAAVARSHMSRKSKNSLELMMECDDEDLSPSQKQLYQQQIQAVKNHALIVQNYNKEKARRAEQERLRKLEEERHAAQVLQQKQNGSLNKVQTIHNASGIVQNIAKQIGGQVNERQTQQMLMTQVGAQPMFIRAADTSLVKGHMPQPVSLNAGPVLSGQQLGQSGSYMSTSTVPNIIQRSVAKRSGPTLVPITLPNQTTMNASGMYSNSSQVQQPKVTVQAESGSKGPVKTTVIRVPTGINIQQHLGSNYKLLTSTGNVYHYVYSPATTTTAAMGQSLGQTVPSSQLLGPPAQRSQPVYQPPAPPPPPPAPVQPTPHLPSSITDILLGKRSSPEQGRAFSSGKQANQGKRPTMINTTDGNPYKKQRCDDNPEPKKEKEMRYTVEQYYGTKEGSKDYPDEKYRHGFKCYHCTKVISNNIKYMTHIKNHLDKEKQENLTLNDIINCDHCGKRFITPFELQCHIEKSHIRSSELKCRICDITLDSRSMLYAHLQSKHPPLQMPYSCPICGFRSSVLEDTIDHFKAKHEGIKRILCTHCLKASGDANAYLRHCQKHQTKSGNIRCKKCRLMFITPLDLKTHMNHDHERFPVVKSSKKQSSPVTVKAELPATAVKVAEVAAPTAPSDSYSQYKKKKKQVKGDARKGTLESYSLNDWKASFDKSRKNDVHRCSECGTEISSLSSHFATFLKCSHCTYRTYCGLSFSNHMIKFHRSGGQTPALHPVTRLSDSVLQCLRCNYVTESGSAMAGHVMTCVNGPTEVEGFKHHTRPRRQDEMSLSSSNSNSPNPSKPRESFEKTIFEDDPLLDEVSSDNIHASVSNIIDRLFGTDEDSNGAAARETLIEPQHLAATEGALHIVPSDDAEVTEKPGEDSSMEDVSETNNATQAADSASQSPDSTIHDKPPEDVSEDAESTERDDSDVAAKEGAVTGDCDAAEGMVSPDDESPDSDTRQDDRQVEGAVTEDNNSTEKAVIEDGKPTESADTKDNNPTEEAVVEDEKSTEGALTQDSKSAEETSPESNVSSEGDINQDDNSPMDVSAGESPVVSEMTEEKSTEAAIMEEDKPTEVESQDESVEGAVDHGVQRTSNSEVGEVGQSVSDGEEMAEATVERTSDEEGDINEKQVDEEMAEATEHDDEVLASSETDTRERDSSKTTEVNDCHDANQSGNAATSNGDGDGIEDADNSNESFITAPERSPANSETENTAEEMVDDADAGSGCGSAQEEDEDEFVIPDGTMFDIEDGAEESQEDDDDDMKEERDDDKREDEKEKEQVASEADDE